MDRVARHLENISLAHFLLALIAMGIAAILVPKKYGMEISIIIAAAWLNLNRFTNLGPIASISKATYWMPVLSIMWFAYMRPGNRNPVPGIAWLYLITPVIGCICVATTADRMLGFVQFASMFLLALTAILVYRTVDSEESLIRVVASVFIGLMVPLGISVLALVFFRAQSFVPGIGRFAPFGINANQLVPILATVMALAGCGLIGFKAKPWRIVCMAAIGASATLLVATASRQGIVVAGIAVLPAAFWAAKRPIVIVAMAVVAVGVGVWLFRFTEGAAQTDRLSDVSTSGRYENAFVYANTIAKRPIGGLLGTKGQSVVVSQDADKIPHNSYVGMLYLGGMLLGVPLALAMFKTMTSMYYVLHNRARVNMQPALLWTAASIMGAIYLHGLVNDMIFWSVSTWTFLHYFLSCLFLGLANQLRENRYSYAAQQWQYA
ncbi:hypothetical protein [Lacipirellula parvula]|uniref:Uncharacterized protein n=1 Tax=Lacipirellula parvula TaxID=2650471 RepID=A0A5K7XAP8_9BACT|nr:hypothetical protein [Lacipirellula parvula]BBO31376.1 hypothetical protein PLANPX_0988 [Lacipirellula parvula]